MDIFEKFLKDTEPVEPPHPLGLLLASAALSENAAIPDGIKLINLGNFSSRFKSAIDESREHDTGVGYSLLYRPDSSVETNGPYVETLNGFPPIEANIGLLRESSSLLITPRNLRQDAYWGMKYFARPTEEHEMPDMYLLLDLLADKTDRHVLPSAAFIDPSGVRLTFRTSRTREISSRERAKESKKVMDEFYSAYAAFGRSEDDNESAAFLNQAARQVSRSLIKRFGLKQYVGSINDEILELAETE